MLTERDLRDALSNAQTPSPTFSTQDLVRRGHHRSVVARSAAGAGAVGVVAVIGVTGVALSGSSNQSSTGQVGGSPALEPSAAASASAAGQPIAAGHLVILPSASAERRPDPSWTPPPLPPTAVPPSTPRAVTSIPFGSGTVAYSLRPEPVFGNANGILLDSAGADGTLTIKVDGGVPAHATKAQWWAGTNPYDLTSWIVYGVVPAGASHLEVFVGGKPVATPVTAVPGATSLAFTVLAGPAAPSVDGPVSKVTYVDAAGATVTATAADSGSQG